MADREKVIKELSWIIYNFPFQKNPKDEADRMCNTINMYCNDALALLREHEPRVMTLEEVETSKGFVWVEFHSNNENRLSLEYVNVCATEHFPDSFVLTTDSGVKWLRDRGDYNKGIWFGINSGWRCWTSRPSPEQMRDTSWEV